MGKKLLVSLAMEGKLQAEGLQSMDDDDDLLTAMARELVTRQGVGEEAAAVWKALQSQHDEVTSTAESPKSPPETPAPTVHEDDDAREPSAWISATGPAVQLSLF